MKGLANKELPRNITYERTELSYLQKQSSKVEQFRDLQQNPFSAFALGVVLVFFVLAGLYESWSLPWAVILVAPMCLLSAHPVNSARVFSGASSRRVSNGELFDP